MGFTPVKTDHGAVPPFEYLPAKAGDYQVGQIVKVNEGQVEALGAASTDPPTYISASTRTVAADGEALPVMRASDDVIYETTIGSAGASGAKIGGKLQVSEDGLTAETGDGALEIVSIDGEAEGDVVRVRIVPAAAAAE